jgi:hypothetical protein
MLMYPEIDSIEIPCEIQDVQEVKLKFHLIENFETIEND